MSGQRTAGLEHARPGDGFDPALPIDTLFMARALELARAAALSEEVPVGALVVQEGRVIAEAGNACVGRVDPTAHAEVDALRAAAHRLGDTRLTGATLYATLEPCAMCAGAAVLSRLDRVVYAARDPKAGMAGSLENLLVDPRLNHRTRVTRGVLGEEAGEMLRAFFRARRRS